MRLIKALACVLLVATATSCNLYPEYRAKQEIREQLKDPDSAQFRGLSIAGNGLVVCGQINAKNSMGGYVGFQDFMFYDGTLYSDPESTVGLCCSQVATAVKEHKNSADMPGFTEACSGMIDGVRWQ